MRHVGEQSAPISAAAQSHFSADVPGTVLPEATPAVDDPQAGAVLAMAEANALGERRVAQRREAYARLAARLVLADAAADDAASQCTASPARQRRR
jgi:hypothetical protein